MRGSKRASAVDSGGCASGFMLGAACLILCFSLGLTQGCSRPRPHSHTPPAEQPMTRSQAVQSREKLAAAPFAHQPDAASPDRPRADLPPGGCVLSLAGEHWVADCQFASCPREEAAALLMADALEWNAVGDELILVPSRRTPPLTPSSGLRLRFSKSSQGWEMVARQDLLGACSIAGLESGAWSTSPPVPVWLSIRNRLR